MTRSFDVFFELRLNKRLSKQSLGWWFETLSRPLWRHCSAPTHVTHISGKLSCKTKEIQRNTVQFHLFGFGILGCMLSTWNVFMNFIYINDILSVATSFFLIVFQAITAGMKFLKSLSLGFFFKILLFLLFVQINSRHMRFCMPEAGIKGRDK